ncbi:hypothetical protein [Pseudomonas sp. 30_B]|uniref:hypothetical protein n=1 Tax=Pseudomonas sp. 30_B TaxID=2813575 RepID=UPI001A9F3643|nr:hypothetical protein [Pseudomonas sp. 30_B]
MTQLQTATGPLPAGPEHRAKLISLAVHNASAICWGRPWRRRALSLPATRELTFQGIRLPPLAPRSWLHLLARAGLLARRPAPASVLTSPMDPDEIPTISGLGFELCTDIILDFAQVARLTRLQNEEAQTAHSAEEPDASGPEQAPSSHYTVAGQGEDALQVFGPAERVSPDAIDLEFLSDSLAASRDALAEPTDPPLFEPADSSAVDLASPEPQEATVSPSAESPVETDVEPPVLETMTFTEPRVAEEPGVAAMAESAVADAAEQPAAEVVAFSAPQAVEAPAVVALDEPAVADVAEEPTPDVESSFEPQAEEVPVVVAQDEPAVADVAEQPAPEIVSSHEAHEPEAPAVVALAEPEQFPETVSAAEERREHEFSGAMVSSLEEAGHATAVGTPAVATSDEPAAHAADASLVANSSLEAAVLQGILIQKESVMTEMHDVIPEAETPGVSAPICSAELREVAAALSVPQLDADPDDVLCDVQSTLNSLAGMAQGLSQQKQAAGRLQEELEEWNNQLQERERLASDKEERLLQLENHLKEAKANLDRMATENNRLLAERSEALKELAQTVDLRDKATLKRAESIQAEQQRIDEQLAALRARASELDERESSLKRKSEDLGMRLKQLQSAKDKFSAIVKSFNETVQFNSTLSAISKTVVE